MNTYLAERRWDNGGMTDIWIRNNSAIGKFIISSKLKPISNDFLPPASLVSGAVITHGLQAGIVIINGMFGGEVPSPMNLAKGRAEPIPNLKFIPINKWGGIRGPHLHFKDEIYRLDNKQWNDFSAVILKNIQERIKKAGTVSFDQLMEISDSVGSLA